MEFDFHSINLLTVTIRLLLAVLLGGLIGFERGKKRRPAGFRTHMLVCIGATLAMLTNMYIFENIFTGDPTRLAAQVISGIGFLGAGTIIITGRSQVKGLTTAAGLWAAGIIGLAIGVGFYEGAILGTAFILISIGVFHGLDGFLNRNSKIMDLYGEFESMKDATSFLKYIRKSDYRTYDLQVNHSGGIESNMVVLMLTLRSQKNMDHESVIEELKNNNRVKFLEEM